MNRSKRFFSAVIAAVLALLLLTAGCSLNFSTATIAEAIMTDSIDENGMPGETVDFYYADTPILYTSAKILNAPDNTEIRVVWAYVDGKQVMDEVTFDSGDLSDRYIYSYFEPTELLPEGNYRVDYFIGGNKEYAARVEFTVVAAIAETDSYDIPANWTPFVDSTIFSSVNMTSGIDEHAAPFDTIYSVSTADTWYISAILLGPDSDSVYYFAWYDTEGNVLDVVDVDLTGTTDTYLYSYLPANGASPEGVYAVGIFIDEATEPSAVITFPAYNAE